MSNKVSNQIRSRSLLCATSVCFGSSDHASTCRQVTHRSIQRQQELFSRVLGEKKNSAVMVDASPAPSRRGDGAGSLFGITNAWRCSRTVCGVPHHDTTPLQMNHQAFYMSRIWTELVSGCKQIKLEVIYVGSHSDLVIFLSKVSILKNM